MTARENPEQQQAELLWKYIEELKQAENPAEVQFVAVTNTECAEVVGLMETAAEACLAVRADAAPNCRREAVRRRLQETLAVEPAATAPSPSMAGARVVSRRGWFPTWLTAPLTSRSAGWVVAMAALVALAWFVTPHSLDQHRAVRVVPLSHQETLDVMPELVAGTLDPDRTLSAIEHLMHCRACMELYQAQWRATRARPHQTSRIPGRYGAAPSAGSPALIDWGATPRGRWVVVGWTGRE